MTSLNKTAAYPKPSELLPHRPPFLFVTKITSVQPGKAIEGYWTVGKDEWFFPGHFPGRPTLPGVLMIEALAQLGACAVLADPSRAGSIPLLAGTDKAKFRRQVTPGEKLSLSVELTRLSSRSGKGVGRASVNEETACQVELMFFLAEN